MTEMIDRADAALIAQLTPAVTPQELWDEAERLGQQRLPGVIPASEALVSDMTAGDLVYDIAALELHLLATRRHLAREQRKGQRRVAELRRLNGVLRRVRTQLRVNAEDRESLKGLVPPADLEAWRRLRAQEKAPFTYHALVPIGGGTRCERCEKEFEIDVVPQDDCSGRPTPEDQR